MDKDFMLNYYDKMVRPIWTELMKTPRYQRVACERDKIEREFRRLLDEKLGRKYLELDDALFHDSRFRQLSTDARTLYGILLDRMSLSAKNGQLEVFLDEHFDNARMEHIYPNAKSDQGRINSIFPLALLLENRYNILWIKGSKGRTLVEKRVRCAAATPPAEMPDAVPDA